MTDAEAAKQEKQEKLLMGGTVVFSFVLAIGIFMILPYFLSSLLKPLISSYNIRTIIEGFVRIGIFVIYGSSDFKDGGYSKDIYVSRGRT